MRFRALLAVAFLAAGVTAFAGPTPPATTQKLKITSTNHRVIDFSTAGGPTQSSHLVTTTFVTVTTADSAGGRAVKLVVDSARLDSTDTPDQVDRAQFDSARGATVTGWLAADGKIQNVVGQGERGASLVGLLKAIFPRVAPRARVGDRWTDTTTAAGESEGLPPGTSSTRVTNWSVSGEEMVAGTRARKVESAYSQAVSGSVESSQGSVGFDGSGTGSATFFLAADGRQMAISSTVSLEISLSAASLPEPVPLTLKADVVVTAIR